MRVFAICAGILVLKMLLTGNLTGILRTSRRVFSSPEDYRFFGAEPVARPDEQIERVRRAHLNDLENILPFLVIGFLYALSGPSYTTAWWLLVSFTVARLLHTAVYVAGLQPWRTVFFGVASIALYAMTLTVIVKLI
jgi:uncharacterized MAPEG superfamily protein